MEAFQSYFSWFLALFLGFSGLVYLFFLLFLFRALGKVRHGTAIRTPPPSVSILLCARNEEASIAQCITDLLAQDYVGEWDLWIADDRSTDSTPQILAQFQKDFPQRVHIIRIDTLSEGLSPKKMALTQLIQASSGEILLLTDADCRIPSTWVTGMVKEFEPGIRLVAGHSYIEARDPHTPLVVQLQALESMSYRIVGTAGLAGGFPLTSTGNNLAYRRDFFLSIHGFAGVEHILSADDDLILHRLAQTAPWAARPSTHPRTFIQTQAQPTWKSLWEQRKRWASPTLHYSRATVTLLTIVFFFYVLIPLSWVVGFFFDHSGLMAGATLSFALKVFFDFLVMYRGSQLFHCLYLLKWFPVAECIHIPATVGAVLFGLFGKLRWKS